MRSELKINESEKPAFIAGKRVDLKRVLICFRALGALFLYIPILPNRQDPQSFGHLFVSAFQQ